VKGGKDQGKNAGKGKEEAKDSKARSQS